MQSGDPGFLIMRLFVTGFLLNLFTYRVGLSNFVSSYGSYNKLKNNSYFDFYFHKLQGILQIYNIHIFRLFSDYSEKFCSRSYCKYCGLKMEAFINSIE